MDSRRSTQLARGGMRVAVGITRKTAASTRPASQSRLRRLTAPVVAIPAFVIAFALAAVLLVLMLLASAVLAAALAVAALLVSRRTPR